MAQQNLQASEALGHSRSSGPITRYNRLLIVWALVRIPLILILLLLFREPILSFLGDPQFLTLRVIEILGTPLARALLLFSVAIMLAVVWYLVLPKLGYPWALSISAVLLIGLIGGTETPWKYAIPPIAILATNFLPNRYLDRVFFNKTDFVLVAAAGLAELFLFRRYSVWVRQLWTGQRSLELPWFLTIVPPIFFAAVIVALCVRSPLLKATEQALRLPNSAQLFAEGDFNWIELDEEGRFLYASGHGTNHLLRYDTADLSRDPLQSDVETGTAQGFAYDPIDHELYVYNEDSRVLHILDAEDLKLVRSFPISGLSPGDSWIVVDHQSNTVAIVSEADLHEGEPFVLLDRTTGRTLDRQLYDPGHILLLQGRSQMAMSFFRRSNRLLIYDLDQRAIVRQVSAPPRVDRMELIPDTNELLLSVPVESRIMRYNANTLKPLGTIPAIFGVRVLATDTKRNLLLAGSLVTGEVVFIDLKTFKMISRIYLGPWLRSIQADSKNSIAYVSSKSGLYRLEYANIGTGR